MFPQKMPLALLIHTGMILLIILMVVGMTGNALALLGLFAIQPIPLYDIRGAFGMDEEQNAEPGSGDDDDHQVREVGFAARHEEKEE